MKLYGQKINLKKLLKIIKTTFGNVYILQSGVRHLILAYIPRIYFKYVKRKRRHVCIHN
jgi:hypothetical protein